MSVLTLHIGGEKTGSKSIQHSLSHSSNFLFRHHGILYPRSSALRLRNSHSPIVSPFLDPSQLDFVESGRRLTGEALHTCLAAMGRHKRVRQIILSAEHLSSRLGPGEVAELGRMIRSALPNHRVQVVFHVRSQSTLYCAGTSTYIKTFGTAYKRPQQIDGFDRFYNHYRVACEWASVFGRDSMIISNFHRMEALSLFYQGLGLDHHDLPIRRRVERNISLSREEAAVLLAVNSAFGKADFANEPLIRIRRRVQRMLIMHLRFVFSVRTPFASVLTNADRAHFRREFAESNDLLEQRFGLDFNLNGYMMDENAGGASWSKGEAGPDVKKELERWLEVIGEPPCSPEEALSAARRLQAKLGTILLRRYVFRRWTQGLGVPGI
jgi:hypothetical protein